MSRKKVVRSVNRARRLRTDVNCCYFCLLGVVSSG